MKIKNPNVDIFIDILMADELGVKVKEYLKVINECTYWEHIYIINAIISQRDDKIHKAKLIFNDYHFRNIKRR
jgi:hypothetical protein